MSTDKPSSDNLHSLESVEENALLKQALGPLITEFRLLRESVNTIHQDYADLKHTISKQKEELKQDLADKIDKNTTQLIEVNNENKILRKENEDLKTSLDHIEQNQLSNNVIITGIPEGPYEQYSTTKLRVQEMIAVTIDSGDADADLVKAKGIENKLYQNREIQTQYCQTDLSHLLYLRQQGIILIMQKETSYRNIC